MRAAFANCIGIRRPNGPTCCTAVPASRRSIPRDKISSMTSASEIYGIFQRRSALDPGSQSRWLRNFLLVFDDGEFDEDNTFLLSDWFKHTPNEVLSKNFGMPGASFSRVPIPANSIFSPPPCLAPLLPDRSPAPPGFADVQSSDVGAAADQDQQRHGADHRYPCISGIEDDLRGTGRGSARRHARDALASQHR